LDLLPRERASDSETERFADGLLACESPRVALRRIRPRFAIRLLGFREAAVAEARIPLERAANACDLDQIRADADHRCASSHSGTCANDDTMPSGRVRPASTSSGRNFPVRTRIVRIPTP